VLKKILFSLLFFAITQVGTAQELKWQVQVISQLVQGQGVDARVFKTLERAIYEFLNTKKWTEDNFSDIEKIDCNLVINVTKVVSPTRFQATMDFQARRPIYNSSYTSILFNYLDNDIEFEYQENQALQYSETSYSNNLTSILGFYANFILGLDYDSYSLKGGDIYYQKALNIVNGIPTEFAADWTKGTNNRYWMIYNMLDATFIPLRECVYNYHRLGLDVMSKDVIKGRAVIFDAVQNLQKIHAVKPLSFSLQLFFIAKSAELINIFSKATPEEQNTIIPILKKINPINSSKYQKIKG
jgi:Domain of unknown function (DUF4835)